MVAKQVQCVHSLESPWLDGVVCAWDCTALQVLYQMLRGLLCLRCARVIHRVPDSKAAGWESAAAAPNESCFSGSQDLKPRNVLVRSGGQATKKQARLTLPLSESQVKIGDLGMARGIDSEEDAACDVGAGVSGLSKRSSQRRKGAKRPHPVPSVDCYIGALKLQRTQCFLCDSSRILPLSARTAMTR